MANGAGGGLNVVVKRGSGAAGQKQNPSDRFHCSICAKSYLRKRHLQRHMRDECIGIPPRFSCDFCPSRFRRKYHMVRHLTSKHGIPINIAQQTTGTSVRQNSSSLKDDPESVENLTSNHAHLGNCDNGLPENLTIRKENFEHEPPQLQHHHQHQHQPHPHQHYPHHHFNMASASPSHMTSGDSGSDCNGGGTASTSPIPPTHLIPIPTYGLTGAITAISAAAAHVEEKDAKILLEAAAAAAQAAANNNLQKNANNSVCTTNIVMTPSPLNENSENIAENQTLTNAGIAANNASDAFMKNEPLTPGKTAVAASSTMNMLDEEWKMKLSLQLISNSLLKERLMNTMPYAYKNN